GSITSRAGAVSEVAPGSADRALDPVAPHAVLERPPGEAERLCRLRHVPAAPLEGPRDHAPAELLELDALVEQVAERLVRLAPGRRALGADVGGEVLGQDPVAAPEHHGALDHVLELAHVARPGVAPQQLERVGVEPLERLAV